jgi:cytochrome P450
VTETAKSETVEFDGTHEGAPALHFDNRVSGPILSHQQQWDDIARTHSGFRGTVGPGFWAVTDGAAIQEALQDWRTFSNSSVTALNPDPQFLWIPEMLDPPVHTAWRRLLGKEFAPNAVAAREPEIRRLAATMIDRFVGAGEVDALEGFARTFPAVIFMRLMGLPEDDLPQFQQWVHAILHLSFAEDPGMSRAISAMAAVSAYFEEQIELRRAAPRDDLLSRSMTWEIDGEKISDRDLLGLCVLMFQAGLDTVPISIGWALYHLATHPEHRAQIVEDPTLVPMAVEEILRLYSFVVPARKATRDVEIGGCPVKAGEMVMLPLNITNRDSRRFENPHEVDLHRTTSNHIAFGSGPHRCLGSHLARLEVKVALEEWHRRIPEYRLVEGQELQQHGNMSGITSMRLMW